ncbi:asparagine synthetase B [Sphaerisporangium rufum]|uniref:asparagine synthase (glutamine-hydrolyzing) n=1 Tax=Sphaerisporangium rufum TaxID=1381558 RepID=A0A919QY07_9ACTN|nr:asparagine synthase (glutamine-hydrolyzing) [Sphaerisporangium rufum]GII76224.1 asparagine synthetase B [Sphaerisporangium rufum]
MCGIAGSMALHQGPAIDEPALARMTDTLVHRGPDATGAHLEDGVALGFRRLSIIDLHGGDQPMFSEDGAVVMVCNGEIFNHRELRAELVAKGHRFRTSCDVEVLVHLYEEEGTALLNRLNGQFAFAIYDRRERQLFLARDHVGILPLHYAVTRDHFVFGSEGKTVLEHPGVPREVDLTGLDQVLTFPGLVSPRTIFRGVSSVRAGHYLLVKDGNVSETRYWDLDFPLGDVPARPDEYYVETLRELLEQSVRRRLQADVPVGFYLSGGLDSSLIAALVGRTTPPSHSFSITFPDAAIDESGYQRIMADKVGSRHHEAEFTAAEIEAELQRMVWHAEMPVKESYNTCSMALSALARRNGVKVILTGEGSDELFGGYVGYRFDRFGRGPGRGGNGLDDALEDEVRRQLWGDPGLFYERSYHAWRESKMEIFADGVREGFAAFDCLRHPLVDKERLAGRNRLNQRSYLDFKLRLSDHLLSDHGDRMALANSVEARYPFLDIDVIEFATTIPQHLKVNDLGEKYVVKQVAQGLVPPDIISREKFGFRAQGSPHLLRQNVEWINDMLSHERVRRQGFFDPVVVDHLKSRYLRDDFDVHPHLGDDLLLVVLTFGILLDTFKLADHA